MAQKSSRLFQEFARWIEIESFLGTLKSCNVLCVSNLTPEFPIKFWTLCPRLIAHEKHWQKNRPFSQYCTWWICHESTCKSTAWSCSKKMTCYTASGSEPWQHESGSCHNKDCAKWWLKWQNSVKICLILILVLNNTCDIEKHGTINAALSYLTILCLYSSEADEIATSQLFCKLEAFAGFKRQNLKEKEMQLYVAGCYMWLHCRLMCTYTKTIIILHENLSTNKTIKTPYFC